MHFQPSFLLAGITVMARLVSATPPACLLAAVGSQETPSDLQSVCGNATSVEATMSSGCGDSFQAALSAFSSVCSGAGIAISTSASVPATSSVTRTRSGSATTSGSETSHSSSGSTHATATQTSDSGAHTTNKASSTSPSTSGSPSGSSSASAATQTGAADKKETAGLVLGMAAVAGLMLKL